MSLADISTEDLRTELRKVSREAIDIRNSRSRLTYKLHKAEIISFSQVLRKKEARHKELREELIKRGEIKES